MNNIKAGDTLDLEYSFGDYDSGTYTMSIVLRGPEQINITNGGSGMTVTGSGTDYTVEVTAAVTADWTAGDYWYSIYMTDGASSKRYEVETGTVEILTDLSAVSTTYDNRSHVKKVLDALESHIEGRASKADLSYTIGDKTISKMSMVEILQLRDRYKAYYANERAAEKLARGENPGGKIKVRF